MKKFSLVLNKKNILITGASGFIGSNLLNRIIKKYNTINLIFSKKHFPVINNIILDLTKPESVKIFFKKFRKKYKVDIIIHLASKVASFDRIDDINIFYDNLKMIESIVEIVKLVKPKKIIYLSSMAVYPNKDGNYHEASEIKTSTNSDCLYGLSKFCGENILDFMLRNKHIVISYLRVSQVYGQGMRQDRIMPVMLKELNKKNTITVFGNGERSSNFISIEKLLNILEVFIEKDLRGTFNIGDENLSYYELAQRLIRIHGDKESKIIKKPAGSKTKFYLDISKINKCITNKSEKSSLLKSKYGKTFIIAEAGVNHNGSSEIAKKMVDVAYWAGADAIKFQTFKAENVISRFAPKAEYQKRTTSRFESQLEMAKKLELSSGEIKELINYCGKKGIIFLSSLFDLDAIDLLNGFNLGIFKIPSGEITNLPFLRKIGSLNKEILLSTGMADLKEIIDALDILVKSGTDKSKITVLQCNTEYPTPVEDVNLSAMLTIKNSLNVNVGYSDHTLGIEVPISAVSLGATVIEKHFTLDRGMSGPDHKASLEPKELKKMIVAIRNIEKSFGNGEKKPSNSELKNRRIARKSIMAARDIRRGEILTVENITVKRPGIGINPMEWDDVVGKVAKRSFKKDRLIKL